MKPAEPQKYWNPVIETLPRERLMEIELKRFREALRWAKEDSPFYRKKLHGIEPEDIRTFEDISKVPMTEKDELRAAQEGKESETRVRIVRAPGDINIRMDPVLERYITSHNHKMDLRGPVFLTVRSKLL